MGNGDQGVPGHIALFLITVGSRVVHHIDYLSRILPSKRVTGHLLAANWSHCLILCVGTGHVA